MNEFDEKQKMRKYIIVNKISETSTTAVEPAHLEAKEEEYDVGPGWQTTKWKGSSGFFRDSSEPILGIFQGIWQSFLMLTSTKSIVYKYSCISWHYNCGN